MNLEFTQESFFKRLGFVTIGVFIALYLSIRWQWNALMDEISFLRWMPYITSVPKAFLNEIRDYSLVGRFYPVKYIFNLLKWRCLPLNPNVFHAVDLILFFLLAVLSVQVILSDLPDKPFSMNWLWFMISVSILQRPLLDIVVLSSIAEVWVALFFAAGLIFYDKRPVLARLMLLLMSLSKEPAMAIFAASALVQLGLYIKSGRQRKYLHLAFIDFTIFLGLSISIFTFLHYTKVITTQKSVYFERKSIFNFSLYKLAMIGIVKCAIGVVPFWILMLWRRVRHCPERLSWKEVFSPRIQLIGLFIPAYLYAICNFSIAGYLLIPISLGFMMATMILFLRFSVSKTWTKAQYAVFALLFISCASMSMLRFYRYAETINESSRALHDIVDTSIPRLLIVNGEEAADSAQRFAKQRGSPVLSRPVTFFTQPGDLLSLVQSWKGDVVFLELTSYFGPYDPALLQSMSVCLHGWKQIDSSNRYYNIYYGVHT